MRDEVTAVALALFVEHGFEHVTSEQIARAAGISTRSFFRYFATKEDVVLGGVREAGRRIDIALQARPPTEPAWDALRAALRVLVDEPVYPPGDVLVISRLLLETPSLRARELEKHQQWEQLLVPDISARLPPRPAGAIEPDPRAVAIVGSALACLRAAVQAWVRGGGRDDPLLLLDQLIAAVRA